jgi:sterol desaturase/sphingolipid hydroxylase (fatty acid hydroxylase superfamily)
VAAPDGGGLPGRLQAQFSQWGEQLAELLLSPGSPYSLVAIAFGLAIAVAATLSSRRRSRPVRLKVLVRALFPRRLVRSASGRTDLVFAAFNLFIWALLFGWAVLSSGEVAQLVQQALPGAGANRLSPPLAMALTTAALFLAYEFGYWLDHYLSHRIPFLWEFHKVHHSAEVLSPVTVFRVHPVDTFVFYNILALTMGATDGVMRSLLGPASQAFTIGGTNALLLGAGILLGNLQHSHLWISFSGRLGRVLLSPAHHQIHHSADPIHHDRNFGSTLAIWDRIFGTLHIPKAKREKLVFGVPDLPYDPHSLRAGFLRPVVEGALRVAAPIAALARGIAPKLRNRYGT